MSANSEDAPRDPALVLRARAKDAGERRVALMEAADDAELYCDLFTEAAHGCDPGVRLEAARGLEGAESQAALAALVGLLDDPDDDVRAGAGEVLAEAPTREAGLILVRRVATASGEARGALLSAVRKVCLPDALAPALAALDDALPLVRREAVAVLGYLKDERAAPALAERAIDDASSEVLRSAIGALAYSRAAAARAAAITALKDPDWQAREMAAATLGRIRSRESVPALTDALVDEFWQVRLKAAAAFGEISDESAAEPLIEAFDHPIGNLRRQVVQALDAIGAANAVPLFRKAAQDSDIDVRKAAERALARPR